MVSLIKTLVGVDRYFDDLQQRVDNYASEGRIQAESGLAAQQVGRAFDREREGIANMLNRFNMGTGKFTGALRSLALGKASSQAGARNQTRFGILDRDLAQRSAFAGQLAGWTGAKNSLKQNYASLLQGGQMVPATGTSTIGQGIAGLSNVSGQRAQQRMHADSINLANYQAKQNMLGGLFGGLGSLGRQPWRRLDFEWFRHPHENQNQGNRQTTQRSKTVRVRVHRCSG